MLILLAKFIKQCLLSERVGAACHNLDQFIKNPNECIIDKQKCEQAVIGLFNEAIRAVCHNFDQSIETIEQLIKNTDESTIANMIANMKTRNCDNN